MVAAATRAATPFAAATAVAAATATSADDVSRVFVQGEGRRTFIYHHHLHKCGGFAFLACVQNTLGLCGGRENGEWECTAYPKRHIPTDYAAIANGLVDFVSAEESWNNDWTREVPPELLHGPNPPFAKAKVGTILREPSSRVISNFLYNVVQNGHRLPEVARNVSILDGIHSAKASGANFMSRRTLPFQLYRRLANAASNPTVQAASHSAEGMVFSFLSCSVRDCVFNIKMPAPYFRVGWGKVE